MAFKFMQPPNLDQAGVDVLCTSFPASVRKLADDWVCEATGEISKVTFWISFLGDWAPPYMPMPLTGVHFSVHADIPQGPHGHSCPGPLLWMRDFGIPEFEVTLEATGAELFADPPVGVTGSDTQVYRVDCPIPQGQRFFQSAGNVYWLDVTIDTSEQGWQQAGWKTSLAGLAPDFAVWTEAPAPEPMPMDWLRIESLPGGPGNLSFAIETEVVATTTTRPPTTTVPPTTTTVPPPTTTVPTTTIPLTTTTIPTTTTTVPPTTVPPTTVPPTTTIPPTTTAPAVPHPADTGPGVPDWRCEPPEVLAYAAEWLGGATPEFQGVPLDGPGVAQAYILRAAAITLAHYQARYEDVGSADPINSAAHPQRWRELPD